MVEKRLIFNHFNAELREKYINLMAKYNLLDTKSFVKGPLFAHCRFNKC